MEANYLKQHVGKELTAALSALYNYGLNTHSDTSHPHKDPISFIARHLLETTRVKNEIVSENISREPFVKMQANMIEKTRQYKEKRQIALDQLKIVLAAREEVKENARRAKEEEEEEKKRIEQERIALAQSQNQPPKTEEDDEEEEEAAAEPAGEANDAEDAVPEEDPPVEEQTEDAE